MSSRTKRVVPTNKLVCLHYTMADLKHDDRSGNLIGPHDRIFDTKEGDRTDRVPGEYEAGLPKHEKLPSPPPEHARFEPVGTPTSTIQPTHHPAIDFAYDAF